MTILPDSSFTQTAIYVQLQLPAPEPERMPITVMIPAVVSSARPRLSSALFWWLLCAQCQHGRARLTVSSPSIPDDLVGQGRNRLRQCSFIRERSLAPLNILRNKNAKEIIVCARPDSYRADNPDAQLSNGASLCQPSLGRGIVLTPTNVASNQTERGEFSPLSAFIIT